MAGSQSGDDIGQREDRVLRRGRGGLVQPDGLLEILRDELSDVPTTSRGGTTAMNQSW